MLPDALNPCTIVLYKNASAMHLARLPVSLVVLASRENEFTLPLLLTLHPVANIGGSIVVTHSPVSLPPIILPIAIIDISIAILVDPPPILLIPDPAALIPLAVGVDIGAPAIFLVVPPLPRVPVLVFYYQFPETLLFPVFPVSLIHTLVAVVDVVALAVWFSVAPLALVDVPIRVVVRADSELDVIRPVALVAVPIRVLVGPVALPQILLPLPVVLGVVKVLVLPVAVLLVVEPLPVVEAAIHIGGLAGALPGPVSLLSHVD